MDAAARGQAGLPDSSQNRMRRVILYWWIAILGRLS